MEVSGLIQSNTRYRPHTFELVYGVWLVELRGGTASEPRPQIWRETDAWRVQEGSTSESLADRTVFLHKRLSRPSADLGVEG
jgi:hypothetical protein